MARKPIKSPPPQSFPTRFQRQTCWNALTLLAIVAIAVIVVALIWVATRVLGFLQPLLVPVAIAGIIAYLLDPLVKKLHRRGLSNFKSVLIVFSGFVALLMILTAIVIPAALGQATSLLKQREDIEQSVREKLKTWPDAWGSWKNNSTFKPVADAIEQAADNPENFNWLKEQFPALAKKAWAFVGRSFGFLGYVLGLFLVPIYLFFFLKESQVIKQNWTNYVPLKASRFKDEVVGVLTEINGYLIAFFRGQLVVSMIDGALVAIGLLIIRMPYAVLIGVFVALLGLIPYIGNLMCLMPALAISIWHYAVPDNRVFGIEQIWIYPLVVIGIFTVTQQLNSLVTAPRIVGDSVGLHPLTVIFSVLFWSLLIGGFLGSLLAVPLTASIKVLFRRYIWEMRFMHEPEHEPEGEAPAAAT